MQNALVKVWKATRYFLASILTLLLVALIFLGLVTSVVGRSLTDKEVVQGWLTNSTIYENLDEIVKEGLTSTAAEDPEAREKAIEQLNNPELEQIFSEVINKEKYNEIVVEVTDGVYAWLAGETEEPQFKVQIVEDPKQMQELLVMLFTAKAKQLPACAPGEAIEEFDPLGSDCWPRDVPYELIAEEIEKNKNAPEFQQLLNNATLDSSNLDLTKDIESPEAMQTAFQLAQFLPLIFAALGLAVAFLILVLIYSWPLSLKWLGLTLVFPAGLLLLVGLGAWVMDAVLLEKLHAQLRFEEGSSTRVAIEVVSKDILGTLALRLAVYSAVVTAVGSGLLALRHYLFKSSSKTEQQ